MKTVALLLAFLVPVAAFAQQAIPQATVDNMNAAIEREANAERRYTSFARRADTDGFAQVAKLFRAAALSEAVLRKNHEDAMREMGIAAKEPAVEGVQVGTTEDNLQVAIGATSEGSELYYDFIRQARSDNAPGSELTLQYALAAEKEQLELFKLALARLGDNPAQNFYVGRISGETTTTMSDREPYTQVR